MRDAVRCLAVHDGPSVGIVGTQTHACRDVVHHVHAVDGRASLVEYFDQVSHILPDTDRGGRAQHGFAQCNVVGRDLYRSGIVVVFVGRSIVVDHIIHEVVVVRIVVGRTVHIEVGHIFSVRLCAGDLRPVEVSTGGGSGGYAQQDIQGCTTERFDARSVGCNGDITSLYPSVSVVRAEGKAGRQVIDH